MKKLQKITILFLSILAASSCGLMRMKSIQPQQTKPQVLDYLEKGAKMDVRKFFNGDLEGFAILQNNEGKIIGAQTIKMSGKWEDDRGVLEQRFVDVDGKKDNRTWLIEVASDGVLTGVSHNISIPASGVQKGNAMRMGYALSLKNVSDENSVKQDVKFEDRIYLIDDKSAIMISSFNNSGNVGKYIISIKKMISGNFLRCCLMYDKPTFAILSKAFESVNNVSPSLLKRGTMSLRTF
jgi:hypothetical protein